MTISSSLSSANSLPPLLLLPISSPFSPRKSPLRRIHLLVFQQTIFFFLTESFCRYRCKRLNRLGLHPLVLSKAGTQTLAVTAEKWSDSSHKFLKLCVNAGNIDASYSLGMVRSQSSNSPFRFFVSFF